MDILFLGTSAGTPTKTRNVTGLALIEEVGRAWYLIDCGEATQHQLLHTSLSLHDLQAIFITHVHGDHCYGLPGLLASAGMLGRKEPLPIIAPAGIEHWIMATQQMSQLYLPFELIFVAVESLTYWDTPRWRVDTIPLSHRVPSFAYRFNESQPEPSLDSEKLIREHIPRGPLWGQLRKGIDVIHDGRTLRSSDYLLFRNAPRCLVIGGDNDRPGLLSNACQGAQVLIHEATYTQEIAAKAGKDVGHSTAADVASFAQATGLPNLVLTHFSPRYQTATNQGLSLEDLRNEAAACYEGHLFLAEDFSRLRLSKTGQLTSLA
ncbi:ribonuclease Z [Pseudomonas duriflava]|uniref:Ribonuclease Z n=1 Tax=Pseudomonas duriflava TaxID=459528 RepID=A0A562Q8T5_9PSED|nr:ribonuclease Z [Pseudomonas duriflava]TWI53181.1 ribonuclease Z [Pseudomonas duriflava]